MALKLKPYYQLAKPGIVYGNLLTAIAGFLYAAHGHIHPLKFLFSMIGVALIIGSGCVFNNMLDRKIDRAMERTKRRPLITGEISLRQAALYGTILGLLGFLSLLYATNLLTILLGLFALCMYVLVYGYVKRASVYGTVVGSISGSLPPVAGYTAVTGHFDIAILLLFLLLTFWQMPHFYAIAVYRAKEYAAAHIPVLSVVRSLRETKIQVVLYMVGYLLVIVAQAFFHVVGVDYTFVMLAFGLWWLVMGLRGFSSLDSNRWARLVFFQSLVIVLVISLMLSLNAYLP